MNCPRCGAANRDDTRYCIRCGALFEGLSVYTAQTVPGLPTPPPPYIRPDEVAPARASRSGPDWLLILLAGGALMVAGLTCLCALAVCAWWGIASGISRTNARPTYAIPTVTGLALHPPTAPTSRPATPLPSVTPAFTPTSPPTRAPTRTATRTPTRTPPTPVGTAVGLTAPDFTLNDSSGQPVTLSSLRGQHVVLLDFWATWCGPCKAELPHIQDLHNRYQGRGLKVLAINLQESAGAVQSFTASHNYSFPVLLDTTGSVAKNKYGVSGIPTTFVIDTKGIVRKVQVGYTAGVEKALEDVIIPLLPK